MRRRPRSRQIRASCQALLARFAVRARGAPRTRMPASRVRRGDGSTSATLRVRPRCHVGIEIVLELRGEECVVATRDPERWKKPPESAYSLLGVGALATQIGVVLLELTPERQELIAIEVVAGGVRAPPGDRVPESCGRRGAMVDESVIQVEENVADIRARHRPRIRVALHSSTGGARRSQPPQGRPRGLIRFGFSGNEKGGYRRGPPLPQAPLARKHLRSTPRPPHRRVRRGSCIVHHPPGESTHPSGVDPSPDRG